MAVLLEILDTAGQVRSRVSFGPMPPFNPLGSALHILTHVFAPTTVQETFSAMRELYMKNGEVRKHLHGRTHT